MANEFVFRRPFPVLKHPSNSMCFDLLPFKPELSVTFSTASIPLPTTEGFIYFVPKSIHNTIKAQPIGAVHNATAS